MVSARCAVVPARRSGCEVEQAFGVAVGDARPIRLRDRQRPEIVDRDLIVLERPIFSIPMASMVQMKAGWLKWPLHVTQRLFCT